MSYVFISYVHDDAEIVDRLCSVLRENDVSLWVDREKIQPGQRWRSAIREAIRNGAYFLACFSANYTLREDTYMNEELTLAIDELRRRPTDRTWFLPILISDCSVPDRSIGAGETLRDIQWVDLHRDWDLGVQQLLNVLAPPDRAGVATTDSHLWGPEPTLLSRGWRQPPDMDEGDAIAEVWAAFKAGQPFSDVYPLYIQQIESIEWRSAWIRMRRFGVLLRRAFALLNRDHIRDIREIEQATRDNPNVYVRENLGIAIVELLELEGEPRHMADRLIEHLLFKDQNVGTRATMIQAIRERADDFFAAIPWNLVEDAARQKDSELYHLSAYFALGSRIRVLLDRGREEEAWRLRELLRESSAQEARGHLKAACALAGKGHNPPLEGHILFEYTLDQPEFAGLSNAERKAVVAVAVIAVNRLLLSDDQREVRSAKEVIDAMDRNAELRGWIDPEVLDRLDREPIEYSDVLSILGYEIDPLQDTR